MRTTSLATASIVLTLITACGGPTNTSNGNTTNTAAANNQPPIANSNNQASSSSPPATTEDTEAQRKLEEYVKVLLAKPIPQKLSNAPQYKEKVAGFRKEGGDYVYIPGRNPAMTNLMPYYTESSEDLHTIIVIDPAQATVSVIDTTLPAVVIKKKVNVSGSANEQEAEYKFIVEIGKLTYSIGESLKK